MLCDAAVVLIVSGHKFLLVKRSEFEGDPWSGQMAIPGGHRENDENCEQTAIREVHEEMNLEINITKKLGIYHTLNQRISVMAFESKKISGEIKTNNEMAMYFWVDFNDLIPGMDEYLFKSYRIFGLTYRILSDYIKNNL